MKEKPIALVLSQHRTAPMSGSTPVFSEREMQRVVKRLEKEGNVTLVISPHKLRACQLVERQIDLLTDVLDIFSESLPEQEREEARSAVMKLRRAVRASITPPRAE